MCLNAHWLNVHISSEINTRTLGRPTTSLHMQKTAESAICVNESRLWFETILDFILCQIYNKVQKGFQAKGSYS